MGIKKALPWAELFDCMTKTTSSAGGSKKL
jgi:hypothetical protein